MTTDKYLIWYLCIASSAIALEVESKHTMAGFAGEEIAAVATSTVMILGSIGYCDEPAVITNTCKPSKTVTCHVTTLGVSSPEVHFCVLFTFGIPRFY
mgnify:CR=1 FL=1